MVTGSFDGTVDFGGGPLTNSGGTDIFLAKFSSAGAPLWSKQFGDSISAHNEGPSGVAVDGSGNVIITGGTSGAPDFGGGPLYGTSSVDIFLAKFSAAGAYVWAKRFGALYSDAGTAVAADGSGNVLAAGYFSESVDFGGGTITSANGSYALDGYVTKFTP